MQFKCKMCGGNIYPSDNKKVVVCEYCGNAQTIPSLECDEELISLYNRANTLRLDNEFDMAILTYESIIEKKPHDCEAHFGMVLCKYGVEYVEDPSTHKLVPTIHRTLKKSIFDDLDYQEAIKNADVLSRQIYEQEAKRIDLIQKSIIEISQTTTHYDIFICYKETDINNNRTNDSLIAYDIYNELTNKGYKVFFSKITLEDKLGVEYEPYIYSALLSSKVMIVVGTKFEYLNSVWVKNEWNRFLLMMDEDHTKVIIPCLKDISVNEIPKELSKFQCQALNKLGAMQDLLRGIDKIFGRINNSSFNSEKVLNVPSLLRRAEILLNDGDFNKANAIIDNILSMDPENAQAYFYLFLAKQKIKNEKDLLTRAYNLETYPDFINAMNFASLELKKRLIHCNSTCLYNYAIKEKNEGKYQEAIETLKLIPNFSDTSEQIKNINYLIKKKSYDEALKLKENYQFQEAIEKLKGIEGFLDAEIQIAECNELLIKTDDIYMKACFLAKKNNKSDITKAIELFKSIIKYKDSSNYIKRLTSRLDNKKELKSQIIIFTIIGFAIAAITACVFIADILKIKKIDNDGFYKIFSFSDVVGIIATILFIIVIIMRIKSKSLTAIVVICITCEIIALVSTLIMRCNETTSCDTIIKLLGIKPILYIVESVISFFFLAFSKED